jgi:hypothetical protein
LKLSSDLPDDWARPTATIALGVQPNSFSTSGCFGDAAAGALESHWFLADSGIGTYESWSVDSGESESIILNELNNRIADSAQDEMHDGYRIAAQDTINSSDSAAVDEPESVESAPTENSISYAIARLESDRPEESPDLNDSIEFQHLRPEPTTVAGSMAPTEVTFSISTDLRNSLALECTSEFVDDETTTLPMFPNWETSPMLSERESPLPVQPGAELAVHSRNFGDESNHAANARMLSHLESLHQIVRNALANTSPIAAIESPVPFASLNEPDIIATGAHFDVTEGQSFNRNLASFIDPTGERDLSLHPATIDWGDGNVAVGAAIRDGSRYRIAGSHQYAVRGHYLIEVMVRDQHGTTFGATSAVLVHDALLEANRLALGGRSGIELNAVVATFCDLGPVSAAADFTAEIDWGDGTKAAGEIRGDNGHYEIHGRHTYHDVGEFEIGVTILSAGGASTTARSFAQIAPPPLASVELPKDLWLTANDVSTPTKRREVMPSPNLFISSLDWADTIAASAAVSIEESNESWNY